MRLCCLSLPKDRHLLDRLDGQCVGRPEGRDIPDRLEVDYWKEMCSLEAGMANRIAADNKLLSGTQQISCESSMLGHFRDRSTKATALALACDSVNLVPVAEPFPKLMRPAKWPRSPRPV